MIEVKVYQKGKIAVVQMEKYFGVLLNNTKRDLTAEDAVKYLINPTSGEYWVHRIVFYPDFKTAIHKAVVKVDNMRPTKFSDQIKMELYRLFNKPIKKSEVTIVKVNLLDVFSGIYREGK